jgi:hypothetical protein
LNLRHWLLCIVFLLPAAAALCEEGERRPPFITTPDDVVDRMLRLAGTGPADTVIDLGSGDGRIVIRAAEKFGARGLGIELDEKLVALSRENARRANVAERASFVQGDVLESDISTATVVTVYLLPSLIDRLQPRFVDELKPGTRIVSHAFAMAGWRPERSETVRVAARHPGQGDESTLHLWVVPAEARGRWRAGDWQLHIYQSYQDIDVEAQHTGKPVMLTEAKLSGDEVSWQAQDVRFRGRVQGATIIGELVHSGKTQPLTFIRTSAR